MESSTHQPSENRLVQKPGSDELAHDSDSLEANIPIATPQAAPPLSRRTAGLRSRSAVMQMQRRVGNAFVQRQLAGNHRVTPNASADASVQRKDKDYDPAGPIVMAQFEMFGHTVQVRSD
jgi:hypothetical protein